MRILALLMVFLMVTLPCFSEETPVKLQEAPRQLTLTFTGDCTLGNTPRIRGKKYSFESLVEKNGLEYPFLHVQSLFEKDDLTIINLEGLFHDSERGVADGKTYTFRAPSSFAAMLPLNSIEMAYLGNNHVYDYGRQGYDATVSALNENGIAWFGTTPYDHVTYVYEKDDIKIGFVSIYISYWWQEGVGDQMKETLRKMKEEDACDVIIACLHGGVEYDIRHDKNQERMADAFLNNGADIVVGNHPHTMQGIRTENGKTTLWSLGNFVFGGNHKVRALRTYLAQFTLSFTEDGRYLGHQLNIIPAHISGDKDDNNYQPLLIDDETEAGKIIAEIQKDTKNLKLKPYQPGIGALQEFVPTANP